MKIYKTVGLTALALFFGAGMSFAQPKAEKPYRAYIVSNAHFDTQWNWDVQKSINEYIPKTLNQNLYLLDKYPDYVFNFEGGIKYAWMKEYYPNEYERMKQYVKEGRWHITGSTWDATDANIPSPESFSRNILYGQHYYRDEFGVEGTDIFLPDCFGFSWTLPTIAAHAGLIGFSTQKLQWRHKPFYDNSKIPFEIGFWQGVDGAKIMLVADAHNYTSKWKDEDLSQNKNLIRIAEKSPIKTVYHYYGTGDTGGSPTIESVRGVEKGLKGDGPVRIISATSDQLYKDYLPFDQHPELPTYTGELLMDVHGTGCYTSQAALKLYNRRNELLADAAERAAVIADWFGAVTYPKTTLTEAWKRVIWHQFHDDLPGTSIPRAYEFSWNDELISMKQFANVLQTSVGGASRALNTQVKGMPLVIYNPISRPVSDVIEIDIQFSKTPKKVAVYDENGKAVPCQLLSTENGKTRLLVAAAVPACGYVVYDIRTSGSVPASSLQVSDRTIENSVYKVTLDQNGDIASIVDKRNGNELVENGKTIRLALFPENESFSWPAWEIMKKEIDKDPVSITEGVRISIAENGPLRAALCVERTYNGSTFKQYIRLNEGGQKERIDLYTEIDWQTPNALLKAEFPLTVSNPKATYDLGIGAVERGNNTETAYEVCAQYWADLTRPDKSYGVSILNDCKYGWDKPNDNTLRLTLLHTPKTKGGYRYQNKQDFGQHRFTYSIFAHDGSYQDGGTVLKAEVLNQPLKAFVTEKQAGKLGKTFSFVESDNDRVLVKALKQAEKSDEYVLRLYETSGQEAQDVRLNFAGEIVSAKKLNGVEDEKGTLAHSGRQVQFRIEPFGIQTIKVKLKSPETPIEPALSTPLTLPYNLKTSTSNAFRYEANFDGRGKSFAAELLPATIEVKGIRFQLGEPDIANGVKCQGDTIDLPEGSFNRIAFLAASTQSDQKAVFTIDGVEKSCIIPSYTEFIGQWGHTGHTEGFLKQGDIAYVGTHKHTSVGNKDLAHEYTMMFYVSFDLPKNAKQIVLPKNARIVIFAATLADDRNNTVCPATDLLNVALPEKTYNENSDFAQNLTAGKKAIEKSGEIARRERAELAIDDDFTTKWCDVSDTRPKFITVDLGKEEQVKGWKVIHAGIESLDYITKEYCLQVKTNENDEWKTVDSVADNTADETDRLIPNPVKARYVRLLITKPDQSEGQTVRIYEFNVY